MRASRADPNAALLGAADITARTTACPLCGAQRRMANGRAKARAAAVCLSGNVGAIPGADGVVARKRRHADRSRPMPLRAQTAGTAGNAPRSNSR